MTKYPLYEANRHSYEARVKQLKKDGYEVVELDDGTGFRWETYSRQGNVFDCEEDAWDDADTDRDIIDHEYASY